MFRVSDKVYDFLKWLAIFFFPSVAAFVGVVGCAVGWEYTAVATTILNACGALVAGLIGMSTKGYEKEKAEKYDGVDYGDGGRD